MEAGRDVRSGERNERCTGDDASNTLHDHWQPPRLLDGQQRNDQREAGGYGDGNSSHGEVQNADYVAPNEQAAPEKGNCSRYCGVGWSEVVPMRPPCSWTNRLATDLLPRELLGGVRRVVERPTGPWR